MEMGFDILQCEAYVKHFLVPHEHCFQVNRAHGHAEEIRRKRVQFFTIVFGLMGTYESLVRMKCVSIEDAWRELLRRYVRSTHLASVSAVW